MPMLYCEVEPDRLTSIFVLMAVFEFTFTLEALMVIIRELVGSETVSPDPAAIE